MCRIQSFLCRPQKELNFGHLSSCDTIVFDESDCVFVDNGLDLQYKKLEPPGTKISAEKFLMSGFSNAWPYYIGYF